MEWYHQWEREYRNHKEEYEVGTAQIGDNITCEEYYPIEVESVLTFKKFWDILFKFEDKIARYNGMTIREVLSLLGMNNGEREDTLYKGKCREIMDQI